MFPLDPPQGPVSPEIHPVSSNVTLFPRPENGRHNKKYAIYRPNATLPPVLHRIVQRAATVAGVNESNIRYSLRRLESNLNHWRANLDPQSQSQERKSENHTLCVKISEILS
jgi:hypothetical protein